MKEQLRTWKIAMLGILDAPEEHDTDQVQLWPPVLHTEQRVAQADRPQQDLSQVLLARNRKLEVE